MKSIPSGACLVVLVGPSGAGKSTLAHNLFNSAEIVSTDDVREWLLGDKRRQDQEKVVFEEFRYRIRVRLENGYRAVADATHIHDSSRRYTAKIALDMGLPVYYLVTNRSMAAKHNKAGWRDEVRVDDKKLIDSHEVTFVANEQKILAGDNIATAVFDHRAGPVSAVRLLDRAKPSADIISRGYSGICVVGDVHGNIDGMNLAIKYAREHNLFLLFLGDIVDYSVGTLEAMDIVYRLQCRGEAASIFGNHERKIFKWVTDERSAEGFKGELMPGNRITTNQLEAMDYTDRYYWENRFIASCAMMPNHIVIDDYLFTHGAARPYMFEESIFRFVPNTQAESLSLFGETTGKKVNGFPERIYNWVDEIPERKIVVVGHDIRSDQEPQLFTNSVGGRAVFLDTGSGKRKVVELDGTIRAPNGHLSWMDIRFDGKGRLDRTSETFHGDAELY